MKKEKLNSGKFSSMKIEETRVVVGGVAETEESTDSLAGTSIFRDINPDPCTKWKCDSTCYCSDSTAA